MLTLHWSSPPRNLLLLRKKHASQVDDALTDLINHVHHSYSGLSVILEQDAAEQLHSRFSSPIYTFQGGLNGNCSIAEKVDLVSTLGGDGTILHAASLFSGACSVPPIVSFSMGTLGFLGEWKFNEYKRALRDTYVSGAAPNHSGLASEVDNKASSNGTDHSHEQSFGTRPSSWSTVRGKFMGHRRNARVLLRNRLKVKVNVPEGVSPDSMTHPFSSNSIFAMNEVIIHRGSDPHLAILDVYVGGRFLTEAVADGMIISTPTGSTAYNLSSGGSIVHPLVPSVLLTPVCPRSLSFRPLVLPASTPLTLRLSEKNRGRNVDVSIDGIKLSEGLSVGMEINVRAEEIRNENGKWTGGVPSIVRAYPGANAGSEDSWVGGLNSLLKFNYPMGEG